MEAEKKIALDAVHRSLGAKMIPFAGFEMPVRYSSDKEEHMCVRNGVGVFDVSHMGEFIVEGPGALDLIQYVTSNDASKLTIGKVQYSCLPNEKGGIVDDLLIYMLDTNKYMLVVNASNIEKDWEWVTNKNRFEAELSNVSDSYALLAVQGPKAVSVLNKLSGRDLSSMKYYTFDYITLGTIDKAIVSATGYTGAGGFEIYVRNERAEELWNILFESGDEFGIQPIGLGARDTLRLEMGYCLYGNDIDDTTSPIEAGLAWIVKFNKSFVNDSYIKKQKEEGVARKLVAFKMKDKGIPRSHYKLVNNDGVEIGEVTSGSISPVLMQGIGLGYVMAEYASPGNEILVEVRNKQLLAEVVKLPFI